MVLDTILPRNELKSAALLGASLNHRIHSPTETHRVNDVNQPVATELLFY